MRFLLTLVVAFLLSGCAAVVTHQANTEVEAARQQCIQNYTRDAVLTPLWTKTTWDARDITFDMLANKAAPSDDEKPLIREYAARGETCRSMLMAVAHKYYPQQEIVILDGASSTYESLKVKLYNGEISWGSYNQGMKDVYVASAKALTDVEVAIQQRNQQAAFQAASIANQAYANALQNRPITCNTFGNSTTCR